MPTQPEDEVKRDVGRRVAEARVAMGLTQEVLAERMGVTAHYVTLVERGTQNLTIATLAKLATALNVSVRWLFDEPTNREIPSPGRPKGRTKPPRSKKRPGHG